MAKRVTKKVNSTELDSKEFFAAIAQIEEEKGIKKGYMMEKITQALISAYRRDHEGVGDNLTVEANEETGVVRMFLKKEVVEEVDNPGTEISLEEARLSLPRVELGEQLGRSSCAMLAVTDFGFAAALAEKLAARDEERYGPAAQQLRAKADRALMRQREKRQHEKNMRQGKHKPWAAPPSRPSKREEAPPTTSRRERGKGGSGRRPGRPETGTGRAPRTFPGKPGPGGRKLTAKPRSGGRNPAGKP